jgi:hypothetical protein
LASYLASTTSSHYQWASALLRNKWLISRHWSLVICYNPRC